MTDTDLLNLEKRHSDGRDERLTVLAKKLGFDTFEVRNSDSLDFNEVYVGALREALETAYEVGRTHGRAEIEAKYYDDGGGG